ncbi:MAG: hypothetical protein JXB05_20140 [Myxococcaceae bacterium]|nr:hypothetical protein [Myxococcaceae bacterium]
MLSRVRRSGAGLGGSEGLGQAPRAAPQPGFSGVGGGLWKMLDAMVDWLVNPPRNPHGF